MDFRKKTVKGEDGIYELVPPSARGSDKFFWGVVWEPHIRKYLTGFVMQICNSAVVHRSNYFLNYGRDFHYRDTVPAKSWLGAQAIRFGTLTGSAVVGMRWTHPLLRRLLPKPGTGPPKEKLQAGKFKHTLVGKTQVSRLGRAPRSAASTRPLCVRWRHARVHVRAHMHGVSCAARSLPIPAPTGGRPRHTSHGSGGRDGLEQRRRRILGATFFRRGVVRMGEKGHHAACMHVGARMHAGGRRGGARAPGLTCHPSELHKKDMQAWGGARVICMAQAQTTSTRPACPTNDRAERAWHWSRRCPWPWTWTS